MRIGIPIVLDPDAASTLGYVVLACAFLLGPYLRHVLTTIGLVTASPVLLVFWLARRLTGHHWRGVLKGV